MLPFPQHHRVDMLRPDVELVVLMGLLRCPQLRKNCLPCVISSRLL